MAQTVNVKMYKASNYKFVDSTEANQGIAGDGLSVKDIVDAVGTTKNATMVFGHSGTGNTTTYTFSTTEVIPSNITTVVESGAVLAVATGVSITFNGPVEANERHKWIGLTGTGTVYFGEESVSVVYPEWWGATVDTGTDCNAEVGEAVGSITKGTIQFGPGRYDTGATTITVTGTGKTLAGSGVGATEIQIDGSGGSVFAFGTTAGELTTGCVIRDMKLSHDGTVAAGDIGLQFAMAVNCRVENLHIYNNYYGIEVRSETGFTNPSRKIVFSECLVEEASTAYVNISDATGIHFADCTFGAGGKLGTETLSVNYCILIQDEADKMKFTGCNFLPSDAGAATTCVAFYVGAYTGTGGILQVINCTIDGVSDAVDFAGAEDMDVIMVGNFIEDNVKINGSSANVTLIGNQLSTAPTLTGSYTDRVVGLNTGGDLQESNSWNPANIGVGSFGAQAWTVTGAEVGDFLLYSAEIDLQNMVLSCSIISADTVECVLANNTAGALDLGAFNVNLRVIKEST